MRKAILPLIAVWILLTPCLSEAQRVYRIGALVADDPFIPAFEGFKKRMAELRYIEGENVAYDFYNAKADQQTLKEMAEKLVRKKPDLIVTSSTTSTVPVAKLTEGSNLPVVFLSAGNPLRFVKSYKRSGNNLTGITTSSIDLTEKRMELLKELAPGAKRVISLNNPKGESYEPNLEAVREAAKRLGVKLVEINIERTEELIRRAGEILNRKVGDAILYPPDAIINSAISDITPIAIKEKLPSVAVNIGRVEDGALATYAPDYFALGQQGAMLVDKILRGASPSDLPIEQPFKLKLVINLKTAKAMGLKIPKEVLLRADQVIE